MAIEGQEGRDEEWKDVRKKGGRKGGRKEGINPWKDRQAALRLGVIVQMIGCFKKIYPYFSFGWGIFYNASQKCFFLFEQSLYNSF